MGDKLIGVVVGSLLFGVALTLSYFTSDTFRVWFAGQGWLNSPYGPGGFPAVSYGGMLSWAYLQFFPFSLLLVFMLFFVTFLVIFTSFVGFLVLLGVAD